MEKVAYIFMQIEREFLKHQNGVVSSKMKNFGLEYKINYGLSISNINRIADSFPKSNQLALYCWNSNIREAKLLGLRLIDIQSVNQSEIDEIVAGISNIEIAEQAASVFFVNLPDNLTLLSSFLKSGNEFVIYSGLLSILKKINIRQQADKEIYSFYLNLLTDINLPDKIHLKRTLSTILLKIGLVDELQKYQVIKWIKNYKFASQNIKDYIFNEVLYFFETKI